MRCAPARAADLTWAANSARLKTGRAKLPLSHGFSRTPQLGGSLVLPLFDRALRFPFFVLD